MIVKIQVARSSDGQMRALIYNKDRSFQQEMIADITVLDIMAGRPKIYAEVSSKDDTFLINYVVPDEAW